MPFGHGQPILSLTIMNDFSLFVEFPEYIQQMVFQYVFEREESDARATALALVSRKTKAW
jgi:hypothetical protein